MTKLLFTAEGRLREQRRGGGAAREDGALGARFVQPGEGGASARLVLSGGREHEILPTGGSGWGFELRDADGLRSGGFQPFRLRRGGRLRVGEASLLLHGQPSRQDEWLFSTYDGHRLAATVPGAIRGRPDATAGVEVALETGESIEALPEALLDVMALGCWQIARWRSAPVVDHLLSSAPTGMGRSVGRRGPFGVLTAGIV
jgi:hypothetical protein